MAQPIVNPVLTGFHPDPSFYGLGMIIILLHPLLNGSRVSRSTIHAI